MIIRQRNLTRKLVQTLTMQQQPAENYGQGPIIGGPDQREPIHPHQRQRAPDLTPEEKRVFKECNDEAYFRRSLPVCCYLIVLNCSNT